VEQSGGRIGAGTGAPAIPHFAPQRRGRLSPCSSEVLVAGYLLTRLELLGMRPARAVAVSAVLRSSSHLHQGTGPFIGNVIMGVIFGTLFARWRRTNPMIIAHTR
jgi:membrane protease YdiL (CAAX protease family)